MKENVNLVIPSIVVECKNCGILEINTAIIEDEGNDYCLKCAEKEGIIDKEYIDHILELSELKGGRIKDAIKKSYEI
jgi:hypothetical protein